MMRFGCSNEQTKSDHRDGDKQHRESHMLGPTERPAVPKRQILQRDLRDVAQHGIRTRNLHRHTVPIEPAILRNTAASVLLR
jgi:hypothetical protein